MTIAPLSNVGSQVTSVAAGAKLSQLPRGAMWRQHLQGPMGWIVLIGLPIILVLVLFGPQLAPLPTEDPVYIPHTPPGGSFLFGTDNAGLDIFSRTLAAARLDIGIGLAATLFSAVVGTTAGLLLGLRDGLVATVLLRVIDTMQALPTLIISLTVVALSGGAIPVIVLTLGFLHAPLFIRSTWASTRAIRDVEFVRAARRGGEPWWRIVTLHIGLNSLDASAAQFSTSVGWSILSVSAISFLGGGVRPPTPEWGAMIAAGSSGLVAGYWWESILPGLVLAICVVWFAAVGEIVARATTGSRR